jgi:hypothetical protein
MSAMDLFERYLQAVRKYLPWQRQDDIIAELRANLDAQREEREAELGRPLTEGEMIDWLKELGPPAQMAGRYQPPRYLIGPAIFPVYWHILRLVMLWASVGYAISIVARIIVESHGPDWVAGLVMGYPGILITTAAWITGVFAVLEYVSVHYPEKCPEFLAWTSHWSPTTLPPLDKQPPAGGKPRSAAAAIAEFVVQFIMLVWLLLVPRYPFLILGPGAGFLPHSPVRLMPVCVVAFWAVIAFNVIQLGWQAFNFFAGTWRIQSRIQGLTTKLLGMIPVAILVAAPGHQYIALNPAEAGRLPAGFDFAGINHGIFGGFVVLTCIVVLQFIRELCKTNPSARAARLRMVL